MQKKTGEKISISLYRHERGSEIGTSHYTRESSKLYPWGGGRGSEG